MNHAWIIEINAFCAFILGIILYSLYINYDRQTKQRYFMKSIILGIISFLADINWALIEGHIINEPRICNFLTNSIYCIASILMGYYWLCYVESALESSFFRKKPLVFLARLPVIIVVAGIIISYFNGIFFYIDENNIYHRGPLLIIHTLLCYVFIIITSTHALIKALKIQVYLKSLEYRILSMFLLFLLIVAIIQIAFPAIPTANAGMTLAFLFVYIDLQNLLISIDNLTGLNNRNQLIRYLGTRIKNEAECKNLYVFMLDINKLKKINDIYGHVEGDAALIRCANALRNANPRGKNFVGRYGGDEFIVIADIEEKNGLEEFCKELNDSLLKICEEDMIPYDLTFSIGYAVYNKNMETGQAFIAAADEKLYEAKQKRDGLLV